MNSGLFLTKSPSLLFNAVLLKATFWEQLVLRQMLVWEVPSNRVWDQVSETVVSRPLLLLPCLVLTPQSLFFSLPLLPLLKLSSQQHLVNKDLFLNLHVVDCTKKLFRHVGISRYEKLLRDCRFSAVRTR